MLFDPDQGITIRTPPGQGRGYWVGAPTVWFDRTDRRFYLSYRLRRPRGVAPDRGAETRIAVSADGIHFEDVWRAAKDQFDSPSIERCSLARGRDGRWQYFVSFVDGRDGRWRVDRLEAESIDKLDPASRRPVFTADQLGIEGVKDPNVFVHGGIYWMLLSYVPTPAGATHEQMHASADIYNTGLSLSCSAVASSLDGKDWLWHGPIMRPQPGSGRWDAYATRVCCVVPAGPIWIAYYDGARSVEENYEERTGLAVGGICPEPAAGPASPSTGAAPLPAGAPAPVGGLLAFRSITPHGPALVSPHGSGCLRYVDVVRFGSERESPGSSSGPLISDAPGVDAREASLIYYEYGLPDGSHDLRVHLLEAGS